jgi:hypothetical protein
MATPKTDITQSVGRILRVKGNNPIIIDLIDPHEPFQNQWNQRKRYYKKNKYFIYNVESNKYINMTDSPWNLTFDPNKKTSDTKKKHNCLIDF